MNEPITAELVAEDLPTTEPVESDDAYHRYVCDVDRTGFWGTIDRWSDRAARWLNPILIKEARQSLKSRQFSGTFFLLLIASLFWMTVGVVTLAPDIYYVPSGVYMMTGYYFLLAIPMLAMVPLAAHRSLAAELDEGTFEMLAITKLSALRIVTGKLGSALLQMLVYFAVLVPCFAFCYLLRGVDLPMIATTIVVVFTVSVLLTTWGLLLSTVAETRATQMLTLLMLLATIFLAEIFTAIFVLSAVYSQELIWDLEALLFTALFGLVAVSCMVLFVKAAASRIAPVTENRSTPLRWIMFAQQLIWIGSIATLALWSNDDDVLMFGCLMLGGYWLLMGTLMLGESVDLSPRVLRTLPETTLGRMFLLWMIPGPGTGYMFALTTAATGILSLGMCSLLVARSIQPLVFALLMIGYLLMYLSAVRLIMLVLSRRFGHSMGLALAAMCSLLVLGIVVPSVFMAIVTGSPSSFYGVQETTNWMWTIFRVFDDQKLDEAVVAATLVVGGALAMINLFLLFREFSFRHVATPTRVSEDEAASAILDNG
ncbi:hypothetical protein Poly24_19170 [Rosistilla carotiformis]|uniref:ABC-2 family transporter protein n=1 Tax=Rosistilla carotiformis TaxID=2528017 RepID=A0A518JRQ3_9BACT|nr:hypothetical protein [Rosistilla carotiformis]QDV68208.1 hypothetical protein Poly24_19170 [Rosistilla carotiformis]